VPTKDYTAYRKHFPKSILVLPPVNESTNVVGPYSYYSTTAVPIAEQGFYVFPAVLADRMFKENGLPTPSDMQAAPLAKLREVFGADAVMYITLKQYGTKYVIISSNTTVSAEARLVDTLTGVQIWAGAVTLTQGSGDGGGGLVGALVSALVTQVINTKMDAGYGVSAAVNDQMFRLNQGLLKGHRHREFGKTASSK
jgi:hypothetical protein